MISPPAARQNDPITELGAMRDARLRVGIIFRLITDVSRTFIGSSRSKQCSTVKCGA